MEKFTVLKGIAAPLMITNVDTGAIISSQSVRDLKGDFEKRLFENWRFHNDGSERPEFVLNQLRYRNTKILVSGHNFGCGSSREAAVWALLRYGIRCVIAPSFGEIFQENCYQNGLLPVVLAEDEVVRIAEGIERAPLPEATVDLQRCTIELPDGSSIKFAVPEERRYAFLEGLDEYGMLLRLREEVSAHQTRDRQQRPWVYYRLSDHHR